MIEHLYVVIYDKYIVIGKTSRYKQAETINHD